MAITDRKPSGALRILLRAPIFLYRARLGWVAGHRLLYIAHRGRRTGARREVVAEVVNYDANIPEVVVVAGWGKNPDWYQNLQAAQALEVRTAAQRWIQPTHRFLDDTEALTVLRAYQRAHSRVWAYIAPMLGFPTDPADSRWPEIADTVRAIAFSPRQR
jgi:deazaflavin-dependent oxidoreductase (nitroreductase family)